MSRHWNFNLQSLRDGRQGGGGFNFEKFKSLGEIGGKGLYYIDGRPNRGNDNGNYKKRGGHLNQNTYSIIIFFFRKKKIMFTFQEKTFFTLTSYFEKGITKIVVSEIKISNIILFCFIYLFIFLQCVPARFFHSNYQSLKFSDSNSCKLDEDRKNNIKHEHIFEIS